MSTFLMMGGTVHSHSYPAYTVMESHEGLYAQSVSPLFAVENVVLDFEEQAGSVAALKSLTLVRKTDAKPQRLR